LKVRHFAYNLGGTVIPLVIALAAFPAISRVAGAQRLGFLGLAWAVIGYLGLLDLGLSRVVMRRVAQAVSGADLARERAVVRRIILALLALSIPAALCAGALLPIGWALGADVDPAVRQEAQWSWWIMMATVPFVAASGVLGGVLDGRQWFGWSNALKITLGSWSFLAPMLVALSGHATLPWMIFVIAIGRVVATAANGYAAHRALPPGTGAPAAAGAAAGAPSFASIASEGVWLTLTNIVGPIMSRLDRFIVAANLTLAAAAFYIVPQELVLRLLLIPVALATTMFPALARAHADDPAHHRRMSLRGLRAACAVSLPVALGLALLSSWGLEAWMGADFAGHSRRVVAILAVGLFANSAAQIPYTALQTARRADLIAKLHLAELPGFVLLVWWLTRTLGIDGAALAWTLRAVLDCVGLLALARLRAGADLAGGLALTAGTSFAAGWLAGPPQIVASLALVAGGALLSAGWARNARADSPGPAAVRR
jgi:O-antigen/teichoic acid export membrane protein